MTTVRLDLPFGVAESLWGRKARRPRRSCWMSPILGSTIDILKSKNTNDYYCTKEKETEMKRNRIAKNL